MKNEVNFLNELLDMNTITKNNNIREYLSMLKV